MQGELVVPLDPVVIPMIGHSTMENRTPNLHAPGRKLSRIPGHGLLNLIKEELDVLIPRGAQIIGGLGKSIGRDLDVDVAGIDVVTGHRLGSPDHFHHDAGDRLLVVGIGRDAQHPTEPGKRGKLGSDGSGKGLLERHKKSDLNGDSDCHLDAGQGVAVARRVDLIDLVSKAILSEQIADLGSRRVHVRKTDRGMNRPGNHVTSLSILILERKRTHHGRDDPTTIGDRVARHLEQGKESPIEEGVAGVHESEGDVKEGFSGSFFLVFLKMAS